MASYQHFDHYEENPAGLIDVWINPSWPRRRGQAGSARSNNAPAPNKAAAITNLWLAQLTNEKLELLNHPNRMPMIDVCIMASFGLADLLVRGSC